jgi:predicted PurR-regulated permease PerM
MNNGANGTMEEHLWWLITVLVISLVGVIATLGKLLYSFMKHTLDGYDKRINALNNTLHDMMDRHRKECRAIHDKLQEKFITLKDKTK